MTFGDGGPTTTPVDRAVGPPSTMTAASSSDDGGDGSSLPSSSSSSPSSTPRPAAVADLTSALREKAESRKHAIDPRTHG